MKASDRSAKTRRQIKEDPMKEQMRGLRRSSILIIWLLILGLFESNINAVNAGLAVGVGRLVKNEERIEILSTEFGGISSVDANGFNHLQFINMEPNSVFLPAILHADMLLYVHTGNGTLSYTDGDEAEAIKVSKGDVYRLKSGSIFYLQSSIDPQSQSEKLSIFAIFSNAGEELQKTWIGPYSDIRELFQGFNPRLLQATFQAPEEVIEEIMKATNMPLIVQTEKESAQKKGPCGKQTGFLKALLEINGLDGETLERIRNKKKDKHKDKHESSSSKFNLFKAKRHVDNCNGWSTIVAPKDLHAFEGPTTQAYMVNLNTGSMVVPHWNPSGTELAVVVEGRGMVRVVCSSNLTRTDECENTRFMVKKGDVFAVPRSQPTTQMSFNNESLVFIGFSIPNGDRTGGPQYLAGKDSFLHAVDKRILGLALNVNSTTLGRLLGSRTVSTIQDCVSCAEEEEKVMEEEEMGEIRKKRGDEEEEEGGWEILRGGRGAIAKSQLG